MPYMGTGDPFSAEGIQPNIGSDMELQQQRQKQAMRDAMMRQMLQRQGAMKNGQPGTIQAGNVVVPNWGGALNSAITGGQGTGKDKMKQIMQGMMGGGQGGGGGNDIMGMLASMMMGA